MPIKNYTTIVPANQSIAEIQDALVKSGAVGFQLMYEKGTGRIKSLQFGLDIKDNVQAFSLPVQWKLFQQVLKDQGIHRADDEDYCYRVAWRNIRDWVLAQLALYETMIVTMPQIFLPYAVDNKGKTLYEKIKEDPQLLLGGG